MKVTRTKNSINQSDALDTMILSASAGNYGNVSVGEIVDECKELNNGKSKSVVDVERKGSEYHITFSKNISGEDLFRIFKLVTQLDSREVDFESDRKARQGY